MKNFLLPAMMILSIGALGQTVDYNKIILPESVGEDIDFEERLVQLAWKNHPANDIARRNVDIAVYDLKISRREWLDIIQFQFNINEFNIDPSSDIYGRADFYPRYNFGARFNLSFLFTKVVENKQRNEQIEVAVDEMNARKLQLRQEVLQSYNFYLMYKEILGIQSLALEDAESSHQLTERAFEQGEKSFDEYMRSLEVLNRVKIQKLSSETDFLNARLALEALIGVSLDEVY